MITCTLGDKKYTVDFISGRAMREMEPASKMYAHISDVSKKALNGEDVSEEKTTIAEAMDTLAHWFCVLFQNQFTIDELYDGYPADRLIPDIALALVAVQMQATQVLQEFPTKPTAEKTKKE